MASVHLKLTLLNHSTQIVRYLENLVVHKKLAIFRCSCLVVKK